MRTQPLPGRGRSRLVLLAARVQMRLARDEAIKSGQVSKRCCSCGEFNAELTLAMRTWAYTPAAAPGFTDSLGHIRESLSGM